MAKVIQIPERSTKWSPFPEFPKYWRMSLSNMQDTWHCFVTTGGDIPECNVDVTGTDVMIVVYQAYFEVLEKEKLLESNRQRAA